MRKTYPTDLSDDEWKYIEPHMPRPKGHGRPRIHSLREILNAIFYILRSGCQWRMLPHDFPRWPTVYHYFRIWRLETVLGRGSILTHTAVDHVRCLGAPLLCIKTHERCSVLIR